MSIFTGLLDDTLKQYHADMILEAIRGFSIECELIYGGTLFTTCPNCIFDSGLNRSSGRYKTGGSIPFSGICPICHGLGRLADDSSTMLSLAVIYDEKQWIKIPVVTGVPSNSIQTICTVAQGDAIKKAKEIIVNTTLSGMGIKHRYERLSEPFPCGFGAATILVTFWTRIEN